MLCNQYLLEFLDQQARLLILEFDSRERLQRMNAHAADLLGLEQKGRTASEVFIDFRETLSLPKLATLGSTPQLLNITTRTGIPQTFHFTFYCLEDGFLAAGQMNQTEIETLRRELVQSNNELSNLTRELHKKNAELAKLNELKNHFLGMAAHDLRNPIAAILSYSELMAMEPDIFNRPEFVELLNDIRYLSEFMLSMITDLLDISVIESGKLKLTRQPQSLCDLLSKTVEINRVFAAKNNITLALDDQVCAGRIPYDTPRIKQVLNNLISNALKFSPEDSTVCVSAVQTEGGITVSVKDSGPGIAADDMPKLFHPYPKIRAKSCRNEPGTGLGLAISKKIVDAHQGRIWVMSEPGKGATFSFYLPGFQPMEQP